MSLERLKAEYQKQKEQVHRAARDPRSAEAKRQTRTASAILLFLGLLLALANFVTLHWMGELYVLLVASCPVLVVLGLWGLMTGTLPGARRRR